MLSQPSPYKYVMAAIHDGEVEYWDSYNYPHIEDTDGSHEAYQKALPESIVNLLYTVASQQSNQENIKESNTIKDMKQNKIRLTESQLKKMVSEAVRNVLKEEVNPEEVQLFSQLYSTYDDKVRNLMSAHAYLLEQQFGYSRDEAMAETAVIMRRDTVGVVPRYQSSNNRV